MLLAPTLPLAADVICPPSSVIVGAETDSVVGRIPAGLAGVASFLIFRLPPFDRVRASVAETDTLPTWPEEPADAAALMPLDAPSMKIVPALTRIEPARPLADSVRVLITPPSIRSRRPITFTSTVPAFPPDPERATLVISLGSINRSWAAIRTLPASPRPKASVEISDSLSIEMRPETATSTLPA